MISPTNLEVKGNIFDHPFAELLAEIAQSNLSGSLRLSHFQQKIIIYFAGGDVVFAASNSRRHRLFHILLRAEKITPSELTAISNFANDMELNINLVKKEILTESEMKEILSAQVRQILDDTLEWQEGNWMFSPLVRIKGDIHTSVDLSDILFLYARKIPSEKQARRFKSLEERFGKRAGLPVHINLQPQEAFVFSRFDGGITLSIEDVKSLSGLSEAETLKTLYTLWLGGFLVRQRFNSAFNPETLSAILSAKFELKSKAFVPQPVQETVIEEKSAPEHQGEETEETIKEITLEEYLERTEQAATFYEILDIAAETDVPEIKAAYFGLAKRFHPDLYYRRVGEELHRRIQNAFTRIAQSYETLRNAESREVYDFKLRKEIANLSKRANTGADGSQTPLQMMEEQAAENFEQGFNLIMEEEFEEAIPFLARAVHLVGGNARYRAFYGKALSVNKETYRQAEAELQAALRIEPDNIDYRLMLAGLFIKIGLTKRAEGELNRLLEKSPTHYEAKSMLDSLRDK